MTLLRFIAIVAFMFSTFLSVALGVPARIGNALKTVPPADNNTKFVLTRLGKNVYRPSSSPGNATSVGSVNDGRFKASSLGQDWQYSYCYSEGQELNIEVLRDYSAKACRVFRGEPLAPWDGLQLDLRVDGPKWIRFVMWDVQDWNYVVKERECYDAMTWLIYYGCQISRANSRGGYGRRNKQGFSVTIDPNGLDG